MTYQQCIGQLIVRIQYMSDELINEIASIATEVDGTELLNNVIRQLSTEIEEKYNQ